MCGEAQFADETVHVSCHALCAPRNLYPGKFTSIRQLLRLRSRNLIVDTIKAPNSALMSEENNTPKRIDY